MYRGRLWKHLLSLIGTLFLSLFSQNHAFTQNGQIRTFIYPSNLSSRSNPRSRLASPMAKRKRSSEEIMGQPWLPGRRDDDDIFAIDMKRVELERNGIQCLASLIRDKLNDNNMDCDEDGDDDGKVSISHDNATEASVLAHDRFRDLTCTYAGELILEQLFHSPNNPILKSVNKEVIQASIIALQALTILAMQVGVKGTPDQKARSVAHLRNYDEKQGQFEGVDDYFNVITTKSVKHRGDITAGIQLLAELKLKRNAKSAFDLLVRLGAWEKHEDLALLRSGFPTRFTKEEQKNALDAANNKHDPDRILGIRKDLRHLKVYTIDSEYTEEVDDGLSIENIKKPDGSTRKRIWIHIADADRWAPRNSKMFESAQSRATSLYLPTGSIPMFPIELSGGPMSLRADCDSHALSMAVELNEDGSIDESTLYITPSLINVTYRLAYDEVDEMLEMGVGYFEEWELGALLDEASKRRKYRISCGSTEGFVPRPIPQAELRVVKNEDIDDVDISVNIEVTHNAGFNQSEAVLDMDDEEYAKPVSSAFVLVTEMMIMSGEAMGKMKGVLESQSQVPQVGEGSSDEFPFLENKISLPFRTQPRPDFGKRYEELNTLNSLRGKGYCHAWYARRFFEAVRVKEDPLPHNGLGLDCYCQWTSPIRRLSDLQVHAAVKRFLRRARINKLMAEGKPIPSSISASDLGCDVPRHVITSRDESNVDMDIYKKYELQETGAKRFYGINYKKGLGFVNAARMVQRKSKEYWLFELIRRQLEDSEDEIAYETTILACVDPRRHQYAIYVHELGFEHRYLSQQGELAIGKKLWLKVQNVRPAEGLLSFTLASKYGGKSSKFSQSA